MTAISQLKPITLSNPQADILESPYERNLFIAGQGSGKSHLAGVISYNFVQSAPGCHGFIGANTYLQLTDSTLKRILDVWRDFFGLTEYSRENTSGQYVVDKRPPRHFRRIGHNFRDYWGKISFINGCVIYVGSLDNYKAHDGKEFAWAILDETKDTKSEAVKEVIIGRLRQPGLKNQKGEDFNPLYIMTSPAKVQWLNEWFKLENYEAEIKRKIYNYPDYFAAGFENKMVTISSTYHNQKNLPKNYILTKVQDLNSDLLAMLVFGDPFSKAGGEFYKQFSRVSHVLTDNFPYNPEEPLHITFDFNVHPYVTCNVWQVYDKMAIQIDEICLESPKNRTVFACREFKKRYAGHPSRVFLYGDPAGKHEDTRSEKDVNDFSIIIKELREFGIINRVTKKAPSVNLRGEFINSIFEKNYAGIYIFINAKCKYTINDYTYLKEDQEGKKSKKKVKDERTGISYEEYGHNSDANDYFLCRVFLQEMKQFIRRNGLR